jgi:hypothetical protein
VQFEVNSELVVQVLVERAAELERNGDRMLTMELERAQWMVAAHQEQSKVAELERRLDAATPKDAENPEKPVASKK